MNNDFEIMRLNQLAKQLSLPVDIQGTVEFGSIDSSGRFDYATWNLADDFLEELSSSEFKTLLEPLLDTFIQSRFSSLEPASDIRGLVTIQGSQFKLKWVK